MLLFLFFMIPNNINAYSSSASSVVLMDMDSLTVIYQKNSHSVRSVASISNIMTI